MTKDYDLFGHGGMMFWFVSSIVFTLVTLLLCSRLSFTICFTEMLLIILQIYTSITLLPFTKLRERLALPTRASFYYYVGILAVLNGVQCVGSGLVLYRVTGSGLCIVDVTTLLYYTLLTPFVYYTFLSDFFRLHSLNPISSLLCEFKSYSRLFCFSVAQPILLFSYKSQVDDSAEDESVSLPHQHSFSSLKADSDYIYQVCLSVTNIVIHQLEMDIKSK